MNISSDGLEKSTAAPTGIVKIVFVVAWNPVYLFKGIRNGIKEPIEIGELREGENVTP